MSRTADAGKTERVSSLAPFQNRNFVLLWLGQLISTLGDAALLLAIPLTLYGETHSKTVLSLWVICSALPVVFLGVFAGAFVDRWDRRRTMIVSDLGRAVVVLLLLTIRPGRDVWVFDGVAILLGALSCFFLPARVALMASLLPRPKLLQANAVMTSGIQIVQLVGPVVGALLLYRSGTHGVFVFDSLTFLVSAACLFFVAGPAVIPQKRRLFAGVLQETQEGLRYAASNRRLVGVLTLLVIGTLGAGIYNTLEVAFAKDVWHVTNGQFAALMTVYGLGGIFGGLLVAGPLCQARPARLIAAAFGVMAVAGLGFAYAPTAVGAGIALFFIGLSNMMTNIPFVTLFQTSVAQNMIGRVTATSSLVMRVTLLLAGALAGALAAVCPNRPLFAGLAGTYLLCALLARRLLETDEPPPDHASLKPLDQPLGNVASLDS